MNGKTLHLVQRTPPSATDAQPQASPQPSNPNPNPNPNIFNLSSGSIFSGLGSNQAYPDVQRMVQQLIGGLGQNATFNSATNVKKIFIHLFQQSSHFLFKKPDTNGVEVHVDMGNVSQIINEGEIRARIRNVRRFLTLAESRLNRLQVCLNKIKNYNFL